MPKLDLTKAPVLNDDELKIASASDIIADITRRAEELGLPVYPKPKSTPEPLDAHDIENMPNPLLGKLYVHYTAYAQYVNGELAKAEAAYKIGVANQNLIKARLQATLFAKEVPKAEVPARVKEDALFCEAELEVLKLFAAKQILEAHYKAYDKQAAALSRIISLREQEFEKEMRSYGLSRSRRHHERPGRDFSKPGDKE
jgi:hypothetical protein